MYQKQDINFLRSESSVVWKKPECYSLRCKCLGRQIGRQAGRQAGRQIDIQRDRQITRQLGRSIGRSVGRQVGRQVGRSVGRSVGRNMAKIWKGLINVVNSKIKKRLGLVSRFIPHLEMEMKLIPGSKYLSLTKDLQLYTAVTCIIFVNLYYHIL